MLPQFVVYISIITSVTAGVFYVRNILRGHTKPNLASWLIWLLAPVVAGFVLISQGAGISAIPVFMAATSPLLVMVFALIKRNAFWELGMIEYVCLTLSFLALFSFFILKTGMWATIFAILADGIAFIPTYIKSWKEPNTETLSSYYSGSFNAFLSFSTTNVLTFGSIGFALYLFLGNFAEIVIVLYKRWLNKKGTR